MTDMQKPPTCGPDASASIPQQCADRFAEMGTRLGRIEGRLPEDLPQRLGGIESTLADVREHQRTLSRRAWEWIKAAHLFCWPRTITSTEWSPKDC